jgi:hypothetical protein
VKTNALGRQRPENLPQMVGQVRCYLHSTQRQPEIVKSYFPVPSVRYAANEAVIYKVLPIIKSLVISITIWNR